MVRAVDRRGRARLPAARVPGRRQALRPVRPDRPAAPLHRRRAPDPQPAGRQRVAAGQGPGAGRGARDRPGAGGALPEAGQRPRPRLRARHAVAARDGGGVPLHRDPRPAQGHRRRQGRHGGASRRWTGWCAATSASARPRWPCGPSSRRSRTASRWPCWCPTTLLAQQHFQTFSDRFAGYPVRVEMLSRFLTPAQARQVVDGLADGSVDVVIGTHRLLSGDVEVQGPRACSSSTRSSASACSHKEAIKKLRTDVDVLTLTATPDPPHPGDEPDRDPGPDPAQHPAGRAPAHPHLRRRVRRAGRGRGDPAGAAARGPGVLRPQPGGRHREGGRRAAEPGARGPGRRRPRPDGRGHPREGRPRLLGGRATTCWCAPRSSSRASTCRRSTPSSSTGPTGSASASSTSCGAGSAGPGSGPTPTCSSRPTRSLSEEAYERLRTIGEHTELGSGFKIAMRDLEIRGAGNLLGGDQSGHIAAVGYDLYVQMVTEAVAELKGEELRPPAEIKLDLPVDRQPAGRLRGPRGPAPRGLPPAGHGDHPRRGRRHRVEWLDRYGPLPGPGRGPAADRAPAGRVRPAGRAGGGRGHRRGGSVRRRLHGPAVARSSSRPASGSA